MTSTCAGCGAVTLPHRACKKCGKYGDRSVKKTGMEEVKKVLKKEAKAPKAVKEAKAPKVTKKATKAKEEKKAAE